MKVITLILTLLLIPTLAGASGKLQDSDFASSAQIIAAGGTNAQLLNDTKIFSPALAERYSFALSVGDIFNKSFPMNMGQQATPANPGAGFDKCYVKNDDKFYCLSSAGVESLIGPTGGGGGPPFLDSTFEVDNVVTPSKKMNMDLSGATAATETTLSFVQTANRVVTLPNATTVLVGRDTVDNLSNKTFIDAITNAQIATPANPAATFDKIYFKNDDQLYKLDSAGNEVCVSCIATTGWTINGNSGTNPAANFLGTLDNQDLVLRTNNVEHFRLDTAGFTHIEDLIFNATPPTTPNYTQLAGQLAAGAGTTFTSLNTLIQAVTIDPAAAVTDHSDIKFTSNGDISGNFEGLFIAQGGNTANWSGINLSKTSGNMTNAEGLRIGFGNGTANSKSALSFVMGDGVTAGSGRLMEGGWNDGDYNDRIGFNINGGTGDVTVSDTGLNVGQSSGTSNNFTGVNVTAGGTTNQWNGVSVGGNGASTGGVQGIKSDVTNISSPNQKTAISASGGQLTVASPYDTSVLPPSPGVISLNSIGGSFTIAAGFPTTNTLVFGNNLGGNSIFNDNMGADPTGVIGFANIGFVGQTSVAAGKTATLMNMAAAGASVLSGGGSATTVNMYQAVGLLGNPADLSVTNMTAFNSPSGLCAFGTNCWGIHILDAAADNSFAKDVVVGANSPSNASTGVELSSTTKAILNARMTTGQRNALVPLNGMQIYNSTTAQLECYQGGAWVACGAASAGGTGSLNAKFSLNDAVVPFKNIDGPHYQATVMSLTNVLISILNSGTSGSTVVQLNQYRAGALLNTATASIAASSGNPSSSNAALSGTLSLQVGDVITVDVNSGAQGTPEAITVEY